MFTIREGPTGGGKSYTTVNFDVADELMKGRPVYCSLEIEVEAFVAWCTPDRAKQREIARRLHFLEDREEIPRNPDGTERCGEDGKPLGPRHMIREFWCFIEPWAFIVIEESAENMGTDKRFARPDLAINFINRQRHFSLDLLFICQRYEELDPVFRRKAHYVERVENSLTLPMFPGVWWLRPIRFFWQFFWVRQFIGSNFERQGESATVENQWRVKPKSAGFRNYRSRAATTKFPWLTVKGDDHETGDLKSKGTRRREFFRSLRVAGSVLGLLAGGIFIVYQLIQGLFALSRNPQLVTEFFGVEGVKTTKLEKPKPAGTNTVEAALTVPASEPVVEVERVRLVTPDRLVTTKGVYVIGSTVGSNVVARILLDGLEFEGGRRQSFAVLFPGN
jgi:hypothetical protein